MHPDRTDISDPNASGATLQRILLVDDSAVQLKILAAMMRHWGFEVWQAESGAEALALCEEVAFDAVLSDWMMPGMTGPQLIEAMRSQPALAHIPALLLTAKSDAESKANATISGADAFLGKPFEKW